MQLKILSLLATVFFVQNSFSFVHFEPLVGYQFQTLKLVDLTNSTQEFKSDSPLVGAKFGVKTPFGVSLDLVGTYSEGKTKSTPAASEDPTFTHLVGAAQLGVSASNVMKLYLGTIFTTDYKINPNSLFPGMKLSGTGYQAGIAFFFARNFSFTLNYNIHQFKKITGTTYILGEDPKLYYSKNDLSDVSTFLSYSF